jgi:mono/diheme cytochrome c family protein
MRAVLFRLVIALGVSAGLTAALSSDAVGASSQVERGKYLVSVGGCTDCHTRGHFFGKPDTSAFLAGSDVGFSVAGLGTFVGRNLTPDKETGLGNWTDEQILAALQKGVRPDGRMLAPSMPWRNYANLTRDDALAIVAYLRSLPPVKNEVPPPFGPTEKPTVPAMKIVMPDGGK